jgi:hypothetical protein
VQTLRVTTLLASSRPVLKLFWSARAPAVCCPTPAPPRESAARSTRPGWRRGGGRGGREGVVMGWVRGGWVAWQGRGVWCGGWGSGGEGGRQVRCDATRASASASTSPYLQCAARQRSARRRGGGRTRRARALATAACVRMAPAAFLRRGWVWLLWRVPHDADGVAGELDDVTAHGLYLGQQRAEELVQLAGQARRWRSVGRQVKPNSRNRILVVFWHQPHRTGAQRRWSAWPAAP